MITIRSILEAVIGVALLIAAPIIYLIIKEDKDETD